MFQVMMWMMIVLMLLILGISYSISHCKSVYLTDSNQSIETKFNAWVANQTIITNVFNDSYKRDYMIRHDCYQSMIGPEANMDIGLYAIWGMLMVLIGLFAYLDYDDTSKKRAGATSPRDKGDSL